jgi:prepilin-type processing-associated H-X9-DG protein
VDPATGKPFPYPWLQFKGIFGRSSKTKITEIRDGTSNTIAFGESRFGPSFRSPSDPNPGAGVRDWQMSWAGSGMMPAAWGLNAPNRYAGHPWEMLTFSSFHPAVINFCFADGSVHGVAPDMDRWTFFQLAGMADGFVGDANYGF